MKDPRNNCTRASALQIILSIALLSTSAILLAAGRGLAPGESILRSQLASQRRTLSFADRVGYQIAIEEVYWRHRIWLGKEAKPSLGQVMSQAQIQKKVEDYLRKSQVLEDYWQQPLTGEQLQSEMDRIANQTKQPDVLRELFQALGNDPFVIAECLARPALAERLLRNSYAFDGRIHGKLRLRAEADLQAYHSVGQMKQTSGTYSEIEFVKRDRGQVSSVSGRAIPVNGREWNQTLEKLAAPFKTAKSKLAPLSIGQLSSLQEDETHYYALAVIAKTDHDLKLATLSWAKEPLESWIARAKNQAVRAVSGVVACYTLPRGSDGAGCINDAWTATAAPPDARTGHTAIWTGSEMIVWGGRGGNSYFDTGARYNPATDNWTPTSEASAPTARANHTAVWTGSEMIVWGGVDQNFQGSNTGGRYNPGTDSWTPTTTTNAPPGRSDHTAVWTGSEMIVWGGENGSGYYFSTGGRYNPTTNSWTAMTT
ncbi:MAG: Kelch repeat-containing protein, partial [Chthoniobacterales bacterium]